MYNFLDYSNRPDLWKLSGERIRERRKQMGYRSKEAFAEKISTLIPFKGKIVGTWERGQAPINKVEQLGAVCQILECDPEYITCQCDTLRKQYADPAARFGLSEQSFSILEENLGSKDAAAVADFVLCSDGVRQAFRSLLKLNDGILEKDRAIRERSSKEYEKLQKRRNEIKTQVIFEAGFKGTIMSKTDFFTDSYGQYVVQPEQARYIAEQQLIAEIRKALEK